jgi:NitT/TauT family transport system permease protein/taurine transport system permease protein
MGPTSGQTFRYVVLPSSLPEIFTGMRVGLGIAWTCLVAAEMVSASQGLGWMVLRAGNNLQSGYVFVAIIAIGIIGYLMDLCLRLIERAAIPWKGKA